MSDDKPLFQGLVVPLMLALPIVVLAAGGLWALRGRPAVIATLSNGEKLGRAFATPARSPSECLDGALAALTNLEEPREPGAAAFLEACLIVSNHPKSTGPKHSARTRGEYETWAREECAARGRAGDKSCALLVQLANVDPCGPPFKGEVRAPARWDCVR